MAERIAVPCFRYNGEDLATHLDVDAGMVRCLARGQLHALTPEEQVRQALLWFFLEGANSATAWRTQIQFYAEHSSLDIAAYYSGPAIHARFSPSIPVLIVETKRAERELADDRSTEAQLSRYMLRERCRAGAIFNSRQAAWLSLGGEFTNPAFSRAELPDLHDVEIRLSEAIARRSAQAVDWGAAFTSAEAGDFDSLLRLVTAFGADSSLTFGLSIRAKGSIASVQGFSLQTSHPDVVTYRARGVLSRTRQQLLRRDFHRMLSIRSL